MAAFLRAQTTADSWLWIDMDRVTTALESADTFVLTMSDGGPDIRLAASSSAAVLAFLKEKAIKHA
jgi:hypothetical protein